MEISILLVVTVSLRYWGVIVICMGACFSHVLLFVIPRTVASQAPLSVGFSRWEYRNALLLWSLQTGTQGWESTERKWWIEGCGGPKSRVKQGCFISGSVCLYIVIQGSFRQKIKLSKNTKTRLISTGTKEITRAITRVARGITMSQGQKTIHILRNRNHD